MTKLNDIQYRLSWFKNQSQDLEQLALSVQSLTGNVLVLAIDPRVRGHYGGLDRFADKYSSLQAALATDLYPQGAIAESVLGHLVFEAGRTYAQKEAEDHDLVAEVADLLKNY